MEKATVSVDGSVANSTAEATAARQAAAEADTEHDQRREFDRKIQDRAENPNELTMQVLEALKSIGARSGDTGFAKAMAETKLTTPLIVACERNDWARVKSLLADGADPNEKAGFMGDLTALEQATRYASHRVVRRLLLEGADVNGEMLGRGALMAAATFNKVEAAKVLLEHGANVNMATKDTGATPLYAAAYEGHDEIVRALVEGGADINVADMHGKTPLHEAAHRRQTSTAKLLLELGALPDIPCNKGATPLYDARDVGANAIAELLLAAGAKSVTVNRHKKATKKAGPK